MTNKIRASPKQVEGIRSLKHELQKRFDWLMKKIDTLDEQKDGEVYSRIDDRMQKYAKSIIDCIKMENLLGLEQEGENGVCRITMFFVLRYANACLRVENLMTNYSLRLLEIEPKTAKKLVIQHTLWRRHYSIVVRNKSHMRTGHQQPDNIQGGRSFAFGHKRNSDTTR